MQQSTLEEENNNTYIKYISKKNHGFIIESLTLKLIIIEFLNYFNNLYRIILRLVKKLLLN